MTNLMSFTSGNDDFGIADEITIRPDGRPELSQSGIARVFDIKEATLRKWLQGSHNNGKMYGQELGKHLTSMGFSLRTHSQSKRGTSFTPEMVAATAVWLMTEKQNEIAKAFVMASTAYTAEKLLLDIKTAGDRAKPKQLPAEVIALVLPPQTHHTVVELMLMMGYNGQEISEHQNRLGRAFAAHFRSKYRDEPLPLSARGNGARRTCKVHVYLADNPDYTRLMEEIIGYLPE